MEEGNVKSEVTSLDIKEEPIKLGPLTLPSPMGIGTWAWGDSSVWGYNSYDPSFNEKTIEEAFEFAANSNVINFWDTAEVYGRGKSEQILGNLIHKFKDLKTPAIVATKFLPLPWRLSKGSLKSALEASLKRLQLESVDLYQVHGPAFSARSVETWADALVQVYKEGKIKAVGVSNYNSDQVRRTHAELSKHGIPLVSNQVEFSLLRNNPDVNGLLKTCKELNVTVIAYSPLAMGRLSGKYSKDNPPKGDRKFSNFSMEEIEPLIEKLKEIGKAHDRTPSQVALNWCICKGTIPIVGVKNRKQTEENMRALGWRLTEDEQAQLDKLAKQSKWSFWQNDAR